jgi:gas vesicle protein
MNAWIAVIGTLSGVLITAVTSLLSARQTQRAQRDAAESQRAHEAWAKLREERRKTFVGYLVSYQALFARAYEVVESNAREDGRFANKEREEFTRAYNELLITAEREATLHAARRATAALWDYVRGASSGVEELDDLEERTREPRRQLREAMRAELADRRSTGGVDSSGSSSAQVSA